MWVPRPHLILNDTWPGISQATPKDHLKSLLC